MTGVKFRVGVYLWLVSVGSAFVRSPLRPHWHRGVRSGKRRRSSRSSISIIGRCASPRRCAAHVRSSPLCFFLSSSPSPSSPRPATEIDPPSKSREDIYNDNWSWVTSLEGAFLHPSIFTLVRPTSRGGAGIVASEFIPANTTVVALPLKEARVDIAGLLPELLSRPGLVPNAIKTVQGSEGGRMMAITGIMAQLHLLRLREARRAASVGMAPSPPNNEKITRPELRFGPFLDTLPLLPPIYPHRDDGHPFPTHIVYWTDDEVEVLLNGTIAQAVARRIRAGAGAIVQTLSGAFVREHCGDETSAAAAVTRQEILDALLSALSVVLSRSFGDDTGRDTSGEGRCLIPVLDLLNHDGTNPNVRWKIHVGEDAGEGGTVVVTTIRDVREGEELLKDYGWRPSWDFGVNYGFVPEESVGEDSSVLCPPGDTAGVPLFPPELSKTDGSILDLTTEANQLQLLKAVVAAIEASGKAQGEVGEKCELPDFVTLFRPAPPSTMFPRRQTCVLVGGKGASRHLAASLLPTFRAAASALATLADGSASISVSDLALAVTSSDDAHNGPAFDLLESGISERLEALQATGSIARDWVAQSKFERSYRDVRAHVALQMREGEMEVLRILQEELPQMR